MIIWDGLSKSRSLGAKRAPDGSDWVELVKQITATQGEINKLAYETPQVKKYITLKPENFKLGSTPPTAAIIGNFSVLQFAGDSVDEIFTTFKVPTDWDTSTDINIHVRWAPEDGNSGSVVWQLDYNAVGSENNEVISGAGTIVSVIDNAEELQDGLQDSGDMTISGLTEDMLGMRLFRDPNSDTYASAASFVWLEVEYISNKLGEAV